MLQLHSLSVRGLAPPTLTRLSKGTVEQVLPDSPGFYACIYIVPKASDGLHSVLDLSSQYLFLKHIQFKVETSLSIRAAIRSGSWATFVDIKDTFPRFLCFKSTTETGSGCVLCGEIRSSTSEPSPSAFPWFHWTSPNWSRSLPPGCQEMGTHLYCYLDNWLVLADTLKVWGIYGTGSCKLLSFSELFPILKMLPQPGSDLLWG